MAAPRERLTSSEAVTRSGVMPLLQRRTPVVRAVVVAAVVVAAVVVVAVLGLFGVSPVLAQGSTFLDVKAEDSQSLYDAVGFLSGAGIISGYKDGTFGPGDSLKRGQATKMLVLWQGVPLVSEGSSFPDLDDTYRSYVTTACAQGWIAGFPDGTFKPYSMLTRQQMATIMVRAMGWEEAALALPAAEINKTLAVFSDRAKISSAARPYVAMAVTQGLFEGSNGCFMPADGITRGQFCLVVVRAELSLRSVITDIRWAADYPDKTRLVLDLSQAPGTVTASVSAQGSAQSGLIIDYEQGAIAGTLTRAVGSGEIKSVNVRQHAYDPRIVRVTVELGRYQNFRVISMAPSDGKGYRLVVDVYRRSAGPADDGPPLICVDPGHGGVFPGAISPTGIKEKDVNLAISLLLEQDLRAAGLRVVMTRTTDVELSPDLSTDLQRRCDIANEACANVFISVHSNAAGDPAAAGTETFYWGTSEKYSEEGKLLAEAIQRNLVKAIASVDRGARTHWVNLAVLSGTVMPATLTEVGFLTNPEEEAKLADPEYQSAAARGIANGIFEYLGWSTSVHTS